MEESASPGQIAEQPPTDEAATVSDFPKPTRRALIASIGGLVGAALAKALARPSEALAICEPVAADCTTMVFGTTEIDRAQPSGLAEPVLRVHAADAAAIQGSAPQGVGLLGVSGGFLTATGTLTLQTRAGGAFLSEDGPGVLAVQSGLSFTDLAIEDLSFTPAGIAGLSATPGIGIIGGVSHATATWGRIQPDPGGDGIGVLGLQGAPASFNGATATTNLPSAAVLGVSSEGTGVIGLQGLAGVGVIASATQTYGPSAVAGVTLDGTGVFGSTSTATGVGVLAANPNGGFALRVAGAAAFSTFGEGLIPPKTFDHDVQDANVGVNSHIMVMFTSPAKKLFVSWVEIVEGFGFRLHLSKKQRDPVSFSYLVLERDA